MSTTTVDTTPQAQPSPWQQARATYLRTMGNYRRLRRRDGLPVPLALRAARKTALPEREPLGDNALRLELGAAVNPEGFRVVLRVSEDPYPDVSWAGEFTDTWQPGAVRQPERRNAYRYFVPTATAAQHRKSLSEAGYSRGVAQCLADDYVRQDMEYVREPASWLVTVRVFKDGVELARDVRDCDGSGEGTLLGQALELAMVDGLVDEALAQAREALAKLRG